MKQILEEIYFSLNEDELIEYNSLPNTLARTKFLALRMTDEQKARLTSSTCKKNESDKIFKDNSESVKFNFNPNHILHSSTTSNKDNVHVQKFKFLVDDNSLFSMLHVIIKETFCFLPYTQGPGQAHLYYHLRNIEDSIFSKTSESFYFGYTNNDIKNKSSILGEIQKFPNRYYLEHLFSIILKIDIKFRDNKVNLTISDMLFSNFCEDNKDELLNIEWDDRYPIN